MYETRSFNESEKSQHTMVSSCLVDGEQYAVYSNSLHDILQAIQFPYFTHHPGYFEHYVGLHVRFAIRSLCSANLEIRWQYNYIAIGDTKDQLCLKTRGLQ